MFEIPVCKIGLTVLLIAAVGMAVFLLSGRALSEEPAPEELPHAAEMTREPVVIEPAEIAVQEARPTPRPQYDMPDHYDMLRTDREEGAQFLWASPLRSAERKRALADLLMNRYLQALCDADTPFPASYSGILNQPGEFEFYIAEKTKGRIHISDENLEIIQAAWDAAWSAYYCKNIKRLGGRYLYMDFCGADNRDVVFYATLEDALAGTNGTAPFGS